MSDWILVQRASNCADDLGPLQLAWLGDAVWELHHRLRHCRKPGRSEALHLSVVSEVKADAQACALERLNPHLSQIERDLIRKGRNRSGRGPRKGSSATYAKATGFETMIGWLFLKNPERLAQLLDLLEETEPDPQ